MSRWKEELKLQQSLFEARTPDAPHQTGARPEHVDALKFAGGSFTLMPETARPELIKIAHEHDMLLSTGTNRARLAMVSSTSLR